MTTLAMQEPALKDRMWQDPVLIFPYYKFLETKRKLVLIQLQEYTL